MTHTFRNYTPSEAGKYDPTMQDWLALPVCEDGECPRCGSTHFGTLNPTGYFLVRVCHDEYGTGCKQTYRTEVTPSLIRDVVGALAGEQRRF